MKKPLAYIRVSSLQQAEHGFSIESQKESILNHCSIYNIPEPEFIIDEGLSGRTTKKRPGINYILNKIKSAEADTVLAYNFSRMFRNVADTLNFIDLIEKKNVTFIAITEKYETVTAAGKMHLTMIAAFSRMLSDKISEDTRAILRHKKSKHQVYCRLITGFDKINGNLIPNSEMDMIRLIFSLLSTNKPYKIASTLNNQGFKSKTGKELRQSSILKIIKNKPIYEPFLKAA